MATFNKQYDSHYLPLHTSTPLNDIEKSFLEMRWDVETDNDAHHIKKELQIIKQYKKLCLFKLFTFLPEALVANILYSREENASRRAMNKLYFKFLFNKINYNTFKKELLILSKNDIILT